ncbi:MAG: DUF2846 domain-containing protein [Arcobacteraceae bacterium]|nr:DUF2846 domain-containing protein [Arcobacteraceae bacterium]
MKINLSLVTTGIIGVTLALGFTGCGAKGKQFMGFKTPTEGKGMVYVYRPSSFIGGGVYYDVKNKNNDDEVIGTLRNGGFISKEMTPGKKILWAKTEATSTVAVYVKENDIVCIQGTVNMGLLVGRPDLKNVDKAVCEIEIKDTQESIE